jgi:hypothetical protein
VLSNIHDEGARGSCGLQRTSVNFLLYDTRYAYRSPPEQCSTACEPVRSSTPQRSTHVKPGVTLRRFPRLATPSRCWYPLIARCVLLPQPCHSGTPHLTGNHLGGALRRGRTRYRFLSSSYTASSLATRLLCLHASAWHSSSMMGEMRAGRLASIFFFSTCVRDSTGRPSGATHTHTAAFSSAFPQARGPARTLKATFLAVCLLTAILTVPHLPTPSVLNDMV